MTELPYGEVRSVRPSAAVLLQHNPGPMTLDGTNTWLLGAPGADERVVVDPGEAGTDGAGTDGAHLDRLTAAAPHIALVLLTHGHHDHSGLAAALHERTGAAVRALDPAHCHGGDPLADGESIDAAGVRLTVLATPGHTSDSVSFVLTDPSSAPDEPPAGAVLTGDTILGRGTTVVAHPDGALGPYLASLRGLQALGALPVLPGHGPELPSVAEVATRYLAHREQRLGQVREALARLGAKVESDSVARQVVELVYADVPRDVWWAAELSVRAQLDYLREAG